MSIYLSSRGSSSILEIGSEPWVASTAGQSPSVVSPLYNNALSTYVPPSGDDLPHHGGWRLPWRASQEVLTSSHASTSRGLGSRGQLTAPILRKAVVPILEYPWLPEGAGWPKSPAA